MTQTVPFDQMYQALVNRDASFGGLFIVGVRTTGIFCRPTCSARKPKKENVEFFDDTHQALTNGYRACKVCKPMIQEGESPDWLKILIGKIDKGKVRFKEYDLRQLGYNPSKIRHYFNKHYGMTFQAYLRMVRINNAFLKIKEGDRVTNTTFVQGYGSLTGFSTPFINMTEFSRSAKDTRIIINRIPSPLGPLMIGVTDNGLCLLEFTDRRMLETQIETLKKRFKANMVTGKHAMIDRVEKQLKEYFEGNRKEFDLPLLTPGTDFQQNAWGALNDIPFGRTRSYKQQANAIGNAKAVRAVARANGDNRIAIIIPCHRVIGSDGSIVGYGGGIHRKQWLLKHEYENS